MPSDRDVPFIPLSVPNISGNEWTYVKECFDTGWVSSAGPAVDRFENAFADAIGARFAVSTSSGTAALHIALLLAGVEPNDEVIVPALTFIAPANAVRYVGAWPVFVDVDPLYWQIDPDAIETFLRERCERGAAGIFNLETGRRVRAILPVHALGHPADSDRITDLAAEFDLAVVDDATESLGAVYRGALLGSRCRLACFSFNGNKLITTGGGGMLVTDDAILARRARYLTTQAKDDAIEFVHREVGYNYRLTNVQAAMGCAQLERLSEFVVAKRRIAERYGAVFAPTGALVPMREAPWAQSVFWLYTVIVQEHVCGFNSRELLRTLASAGVEARPLWQPLHLSPAHVGAFAQPCPVAEQLARTCLSIPCSTHLTTDEQERVIQQIEAACARPLVRV